MQTPSIAANEVAVKAICNHCQDKVEMSGYNSRLADFRLADLMVSTVGRVAASARWETGVGFSY